VTAKNQREATAEAFAAWFLMPRQLVLHLLGALSIVSEPSPEEVYRLSLELGTSYLATVTQLRTLKIIPPTTHDRLAKVPPKWIKMQIAAHGPGDSWGDVWLVRPEQEGERTAITPRPGDEIVIELQETPSTGYIWQLRDAPDHLELVDSDFEPRLSEGSRDERYGSAGNRRFILRADREGHETLRMEMSRPWEAGVRPAKVLTLELLIEGRHETQLAEVS